ncbi:MAG TPA: hypothetical protein VFG77_03015 [Nitrososphaeraceae archaeon]|jgi:hypothetical protein|nr:hypothetical protein [Nitrososphaeraceae archaeon]
MRNMYVNESSDPLSVIPLSTNGGTTHNAVWKQRKDTWYVVEQGNEKNVIDILTPRQFQEAIENGKYSFKW